jgi:hypothetical protein
MAPPGRAIGSPDDHPTTRGVKPPGGLGMTAWPCTSRCPPRGGGGPTEAVNLLTKKVKPVGHGFRNFANYRLRLLPHCGVIWQTHRTARLRGGDAVEGVFNA